MPRQRSALAGIFWMGALVCLTGGIQNLAAEDADRHEFVQIRMGIPVRIIVYADSPQTANQASQAAYDRLRHLDRALSDYDPDSELMQLCARAAPGQPVPVSQELFTVLTAARKLYEQSGGAFDVTVGPIVKLWRVARRRKVLPDDEKLHAALDRVGFANVLLEPHTRSVTFQKEGIQLDLGGIAKGYAADEALKTLARHGITRALVAVAGDIRVGDPPSGRSFWRVEVERRGKTPDAQEPPLVLHLANQAVSTSGDAYQFLEINGTRYSHIVDPKTGLGITTPGSVTVVAPTGILADGLASAVSILGPQRGLKLIESLPGTETLFVELRTDGARRETSSPGWKTLLTRE